LATSSAPSAAPRVTAVEDERTRPVFNLQVADGDSFFVGRQATLVHDNSLVRPVTEPFDATEGEVSRPGK
jgi:hypothetical protein